MESKRRISLDELFERIGSSSQASTNKRGPTEGGERDDHPLPHDRFVFSPDHNAGRRRSPGQKA